jgi:hypothetical protein
MADDNVDLRFLAAQNARILEELAEARSERGGMRADIQREFAAMRVDQGRTNELLEKKVNETRFRQSAAFCGLLSP